MSYKLLLLSTLTAGFALQALPVCAQSGDIIVTARKREESILKVPVIETAISSIELEKYSTNNLQLVQNRVPGLLFGNSVGAIGQQISLRGIGTSVLTPSIDQSVSLSIDGVQATQGMAYSLGFFDVGQVEVLKGPQALFYGKASPGGVISMKGALPTNELEIVARAGYEFEAETQSGEFIISGPFSDTLAGRLALSYSDSEGAAFTNAAVALPGTGGRNPTNRNVAPKEEFVGRGTLRWTPNDALDATLRYTMSKSKEEGGGYLQLGSCPGGPRVGPAGVPFFGVGEDCKLDKTYYITELDSSGFAVARNNGITLIDIDQSLGALDVNYKLTDDLTLSSVTGLYSVANTSLFNGSMGGFAASTIAVDADFRRRDFSEEVRLTSDYDTPLNFVLGGYYQKGKMTYRNNLLANTTYLLPPRLNLGYQVIDIEAKSAFGQLLWKIRPDLELAGGVRWTDEERDLTVQSELNAFLQQVAPYNVAVKTPNLSAARTTPEISLTYTPTDDLTIFASYKEAAKSGSFNIVTIPAPNEEVSFGDEKVKGYEVGVKSRLFNRTLNLNAAAYHYEYSGLQVGANVNTNVGTGVSIIVLNAAAATIEGVELDANYRPPVIPGLSLNASINYNKATYDTFNNAQCWGGQTIAQGCNKNFNAIGGFFTAQDLSGRPLQRAPEWSASFGLDYERELSNGMSLAFGASTIWSDDYYTNLNLRSDTIQESYFKTSANIALRGPNNGWEVALIGNNLQDEITSGNCSNSNFANGVVFLGTGFGSNAAPPAGTDALLCAPESAREIKLRLTVRPMAFFRSN